MNQGHMLFLVLVIVASVKEATFEINKVLQ